MRLCLRAWREAADGAPTGPREQPHRWADPARYTLARRLFFPAFPNGPSHGPACSCKKCQAVPRQGWHADAWPARFVLSWLRLVRATHSRRTAAWRGAQRDRDRKARAGTAGATHADLLGDRRAGRAHTRARSRQAQQQHGWADGQLPPARHGCYWGCRGECRAVPSARADGDAPDGSAASDDTDDSSDGSTGDGAAPSKRRRVGGQHAALTPRPLRRTRRTDTLLQLRPPARLALRERLADADARLTHGCRSRPQQL